MNKLEPWGVLITWNDDDEGEQQTEINFCYSGVWQHEPKPDLTDTLFLFEIYMDLVDNDRLSEHGEYSKSCTLIKDWLRELLKKAEITDILQLRDEFNKIIGEELWGDQDFYPIFVTAFSQPHFDTIRQSIFRKMIGKTCTEEETGEIKDWVRDTTILLGSDDQEILERIQTHFPTEYGQAIEERDGPDYESWTNIELAECLVENYPEFEGREAADLAAWDRGDLLKELANDPQEPQEPQARRSHIGVCQDPSCPQCGPHLSEEEVRDALDPS